MCSSEWWYVHRREIGMKLTMDELWMENKYEIWTLQEARTPVHLARFLPPTPSVPGQKPRPHLKLKRWDWFELASDIHCWFDHADNAIGILSKTVRIHQPYSNWTSEKDIDTPVSGFGILMWKKLDFEAFRGDSGRAARFSWRCPTDSPN